jgi:ABC-type enterochelin transport system permease subunit
VIALNPTETIGLLISLLIVTVALGLASRARPPAMVTMAVALLTLAVLAAWVADPKRADNLVPLIGVGIGALATALTSMFDPANKSKNDPDDEVQNPD